MHKHARIMVAGARGMVGRALVRRLQADGYGCILEVDRAEADLTNQAEVASLYRDLKPDCVLVAAARVGGIVANSTFPADFLYQNLMIECNLVHGAYVQRVKKLLFLGSTCIYPKLAPQPIQEAALLTGPLEPTNEAYALAKICGLKLCDYYSQQYGCNFVSAMPTNLYGYGDNFHAEHSHVIPGLMRRFHEAKLDNVPEVVCWGSGAPMREFLFIEDLAEALVFLMAHFEGPGFVNVGTGEEISIAGLVDLIRETVGYTGLVRWDTRKPDGTPRKLADVTRIHQLGWHHRIELAEGLARTYEWFLANETHLRK